MLYYEERVKLTKFVKTMYDRKFSNEAGGNVSVKVSDKHFIMTPTLASQNFLWDLRPEQILVIDKDEQIIEGTGKVTREVNMHMAAFKECKQIKCVIHAHPFNSLVFASLGLEMPNLTEGTQKLGQISCLEFAPATTPELGEVVREAVKKDQAIPKAYLLRKHGVLVVGSTIEKTFDMLGRLEWNAKVAKEYLVLKQIGVEGIDDLSTYNYNTEE